MSIRTLFFIFPIFLFLGCVERSPKIVKPVVVAIKTPIVKFHDTGFITYSDESLNLKLYNAGTAIWDVTIEGDDVCLDNGCVGVNYFMEKFFSTTYPNGVFEKVLRAKPIFDSESITQKDSGFVQKITSNGYNIYYKVSKGKQLFKDRNKNITIMIRQIERKD